MIANNILALRNAAIAGQGVTALPHLIGQTAAQTGLLVPVLTEWALPIVPVHAIYASPRYLSPNIRAFIDVALESMAKISGLSVAAGAS